MYKTEKGGHEIFDMFILQLHVFFFFYCRAEIPIYPKMLVFLYIYGLSEAKKKSSILKLYIVWLPRVYILLCTNTSNRQFIQNGGWICEQLFAV